MMLAARYSVNSLQRFRPPLPRSFPPGSQEPVSHLYGDFAVARLTQSHQVRLVVCPTMPQWQDVVNLCSFCQPAFPPAQFTQRVRRKESSPYLFPFTACIQFPCSFVTAVPVVLAVSQLFVFLAEPLFRQVRTTGVAARPLGFLGQSHHLRA